MEQYNQEYTVCPHCGYVEGTPADEAVHMIPGTMLENRYLVGKVLGYGGFGATYIAWDTKLEQKVDSRVPQSCQVQVLSRCLRQ